MPTVSYEQTDAKCSACLQHLLEVLFTLLSRHQDLPIFLPRRARRNRALGRIAHAPSETRIRCSRPCRTRCNVSCSCPGQCSRRTKSCCWWCCKLQLPPFLSRPPGVGFTSFYILQAAVSSSTCVLFTVSIKSRDVRVPWCSRTMSRVLGLVGPGVQGAKSTNSSPGSRTSEQARRTW